MEQVIGIDVGGTTIKLATLDLQGNIQKKWQINTDLNDNGIHIPESIARFIKSQVLAELSSEDQIIGIGIGVPGPISSDGTTVTKAVNLGWNDMPLKPALEGLLNIHVALVNDANAAALGEMWKGAAVGKENLIFVTLGTGVGGGIIIDGKVVNGSNSSGGEIGHIPLFSAEERVCGCGNTNCLETFSSANGLVKTMRNILEKNNISQAPFTTLEIFKWVEEGNVQAKQALDITLSYLGTTLAGLINTLDVEKIVIGGGLSSAGEALLSPLRLKIDKHVFPQIRGNYEVSKALLGNDAGVVGAAYQLLHII